MNEQVDRFHFEEKKKGVPYHRQGTLKFDAPRLRAKREQIRKSPKLRTAVEQFWSCCGKELDDNMNFDEYSLLHDRIVRALAPELTMDEAK